MKPIYNIRTNKIQKKIIDITNSSNTRLLRRNRAVDKNGIIYPTNFVREKDKVIKKENLIYFDIETVKYNEKIDAREDGANTTTVNNLFQYSLATEQKDEMDTIIFSIVKGLIKDDMYNYYDVGKTLPSKNRVLERKLPFNSTTTIQSKRDIYENEELIDSNIYVDRFYDSNTKLYYCNVYCEYSFITLKLLSYAFQETIYSKKSKKQTLNWAGYRSNNFDTLIFKQAYYETYLSKEEIEKLDKYYKKYVNLNESINEYTEEKGKVVKYLYKEPYTLRENNIDKSIEVKRLRGELKNTTSETYGRKIYDLYSLGKAFNLNSLADMGRFIGVEKLEHKIFDNVIESISYNNRDVEILYYFVDYLNNHNIFLNNYSDHARKIVFNEIFEEYNVDYIRSDAKINKFGFIGGKTEAYILESFKNDNLRYIDANSLYPSTHLLDFIVGKVVESEEKKTNLYYELIPIKSMENIGELHKTILKCGDDLIEMIDSYGYNHVKLKEMYDYHFNKNYFYMGNFKINGFREGAGKNGKILTESVIKKLKFYFPFSYKTAEKRLFNFVKGKSYQIGFYEIMFLGLMDFDILEIYSTPKGDSRLKKKVMIDFKKRQESMSKSEKASLKAFMNTAYFGVFGTKKKPEYINLNGDGLISNYIKKTIKEGKKLSEYLYTLDGKDIFKIFKSPQGEYYKGVEDGITVPFTDRSIPLFFHCTTSHARFLMMSNTFINDIMNNKNEISIYATDTDSVFIKGKFMDILKEKNPDMFGPNLLQFKDELEGKKVLYASFPSPKTYFIVIKDIETGELDIVSKNKGTGIFFKKELSLQSTKKDYEKTIKNSFSEVAEQKRAVIVNSDGTWGNYLYNRLGKNEYSTTYKRIMTKYSFLFYTIDSYIELDKKRKENGEETIFTENKLNEIIKNAENITVDNLISYNNVKIELEEYIELLDKKFQSNRYIK